MPNFSDTPPMILNTTLDAVMPVDRELFARFGVTEQQWRVLWVAVARIHMRIAKTISPADWRVMEATLAKIGDETRNLLLDQILASDTRNVTA